MNGDEMEFELDDEEVRFETDERVAGLRAQMNDYGPPVALDEEIEEPSPGESGEGEYAMRLYELSQREFESDSELEHELDDLLNEMEREYFLGGLMKKVASGAGGLLKKAASGVAKGLPGALKSVTNLASSALKGGMLKPLAQAALSFVPGGSMVLPALEAIGFGGGGAPMAAPQQFDALGALGGALGGGGGFGGMPNVSQFGNLAQLLQEAFSQLAMRTDSELTDPTQALRVANDSFQAALNKVAKPGKGGRARRVVYLSPGEEIVIRVRR